MAYKKEGYALYRDLSIGKEGIYNWRNFRLQKTNDSLGLVCIKYRGTTDTIKAWYIIFALETNKKMVYPQDSTLTFRNWLVSRTDRGYNNTALIGMQTSGNTDLPTPPDDSDEWNETSSLYYVELAEKYKENEKVGFIERMNIPMYDFSNYDKPPENAFDNINKYIENGDDSGADNYDDIAEWQVLLKVWLDGNYPNLYIRPTKNSKVELPEGTLNNLSIQIRSTVDLAGDRFYTALNNSTNYVSYSEYEDVTQIIGTTKYHLTLYNLGETVLDGFFTVNKDGSIGETTGGISNHYLIEFYPNSTPSDNSYPENDDSKWNITPSTNEFSGANTLTKTYEIDSNGVIELGKFMWSSTFKDNIFSLVQSPIENIVSLKAMPISGEGTTVEKIKIGNVESAIDGKVVHYADGIKHYVGELKIPRLFNNFVDFSSVNITIYLPFIGFKQLDPVLYMNRKLYLEYIYDTIYGNVLAVISIKDKDGNKLTHDVFQANCGIDIAITSTNRGQIESGYVRGALNTINDLVSGNLLGSANDVYNSMAQQFHSQSNGVGNASLMNKMDMTARIIMKRPQMFEPNNYGHIFGYPCHQYKTVSEFTNEKYNTFIKCENFVCSNLEGAFDDEKEELKMLMEQGVFV